MPINYYQVRLHLVAFLHLSPRSIKDAGLQALFINELRYTPSI